MTEVLQRDVEVARVPPSPAMPPIDPEAVKVDDIVPRTCTIMNLHRPFLEPSIFVRPEYIEALNAALDFSTNDPPDSFPVLQAEDDIAALNAPLTLPDWPSLEQLFRLVQDTASTQGSFVLTGHPGIGELLY